MEQLKPCPYCGNVNVAIVTRIVGNRFPHYEYAVACKNCGASGPNDLSESGAVKMWNLRREAERTDETQ